MYGQDGGVSPHKKMAMGMSVKVTKTPAEKGVRMCNMVGNKAKAPGSAPNMHTDEKALTYNP